MTNRIKYTQVIAAAKSGISVRTARRIDHQAHQPKQSQRSWRTRKDPLSLIWEPIVLPLLQRVDGLTAVGIFDFLCEHHSNLFDPATRRTLERRIAGWRQLHGSAQDVIFIQTHTPGELGIADFTVVDEPITIAGNPLSHRLFHYRLVASRWGYAQVTYGGESFAALADGLGRAFQASGGVPKQLRTDSLSAAYKNRHDQEDFTQRFADLCQHYNLHPTRNNRGVAHENGAIESPNNHIKRQLHQALILRGSHDFTSRDAYEAFIHNLVTQRNHRVRTAFTNEQRQLQPLPTQPSVNYTECLLTVSRTSTINLKHVCYSVPSRLVNARVLIRLYDRRLEVWCQGEHTVTLERIYPSRTEHRRHINYQHIIESLVKKPRAFRHAQWRDDLLPNEDYRQIWMQIDSRLEADAACKYMVGLLHLAKKGDCEAALGRYVIRAIAQGRHASLAMCEQHFLSPTPSAPCIPVEQHALRDYQDLLTGAYA